MQELYFPLDAILVPGTQRIFDQEIETVSRRGIKSHTALFWSTSISKRLTIVKGKIRTITVQHTSKCHL